MNLPNSCKIQGEEESSSRRSYLLFNLVTITAALYNPGIYKRTRSRGLPFLGFVENKFSEFLHEGVMNYPRLQVNLFVVPLEERKYDLKCTGERILS